MKRDVEIGVALEDETWTTISVTVEGETEAELAEDRATVKATEKALRLCEQAKMSVVFVGLYHLGEIEEGEEEEPLRYPNMR